MRETIPEKAVRLLSTGAVHVQRADGVKVAARVEGDHGRYLVVCDGERVGVLVSRLEGLRSPCGCRARHNRGGGGVSAAYEFCRECSSWFCPHVSSWMYEGNEEAIAAWSDEPEQQQEIVW